MQLGHQLLGCVDGRLESWVRIFVEPVKILVERVIPEVPSVHSIWVQAWYNLEYEVISEPLGRFIIFHH